MIKITELGDITSYKRLYMQFEDSAGNKAILFSTTQNPDDEDYASIEARIPPLKQS